MRGGNCQTCKHFLKIDEYPGGHYIGICQGERLGVKVDGLSICDGFQLDSDNSGQTHLYLLTRNKSLSTGWGTGRK